MISLGSACLKQGDYQKAVEYLECGIGQKRQLVLKPSPEQVIRDHLKLCEAYKGLNNLSKCLSIYDFLISFTQKNMPERPEQVGQYHNR